MRNSLTNWISITPDFIFKWLKERKIGDKGWNGGYSISYYDFMGDVRESFTQSMDLKEMGCDAFVAVLRKYGMDAYMESRAD